MKLRLTIILFLLVNSFCFAQKTLLSLDEQGKYIYYEVVNLKKPVDSMYANATKFLKEAYPEARLKFTAEDLTNRSVTGQGSFIYSKTILGAGHPDGEITYDLKIEIKEDKYRYWLTNFKFIPYQRNRYGVFEPIVGVVLPFEASNKINKKDLESYKLTTVSQSQKLADNLKSFMNTTMEIKQSEVKNKVISTDKW